MSTESEDIMFFERPKIQKLLITGAAGMVGSDLTCKLSENTDLTLICPHSREFNILNEEYVRSFLEVGNGSQIDNNPPADAIVHFAAYTNVDLAEQEKDEVNGKTWRTNVDGTEILAKAAKEKNIPFIYISTGFVFPGSEKYPGPYDEKDDIKMNLNFDDLTWYGYTKYLGEHVVRHIGGKYAIVRIDFPFGNKKNDGDYVSKIKRAIENGLPLFTDQKITPTYTKDLSRAIQKILSSKSYFEDTYHIACKGLTTPYEFGNFVANCLEIKKGVTKGSLEKYLIDNPSVARRPIYGGLKTEYTEKKLGIECSSWQDAIADYISDLLSK